MILFDVSPAPGGIGIFAGVAFFLVFVAIAVVLFKLLKRSVRMAFRIVIVAVVIAIAIAGSAFFLMLGTAKPVRPPQRPNTQQK